MNDNFDGKIRCGNCGHLNEPYLAKCEKCDFSLKQEKSGRSPALLLIPLLLGAAGAGIYFFSGGDFPPGPTPTPSPSPTPTPSLSPTPTPSPSPLSSIEALQYFSEGDSLLLPVDDDDKIQGIEAYSRGDYTSAISSFERSRELEGRANDPETLIYLNNAVVGDQESNYIAAVVPASDLGPRGVAGPAQELLRGVAMIQQDINNVEGLTPVKVLIIDDGNDKEQAELVAQAIVQDERDILFVVGHGKSSTTLAAAPIYQESGVVMMAPTSTSTDLTDIKRGDLNYVYRAVPSDEFSATRLAHYVSNVLQEDLVLSYYDPNDAFSNSLNSAFTRAFANLSGQVTNVNLSGPNPSERLSESTDGVIALFPSSDTLSTAYEVARVNSSLNRLPTVGGDALYREESLIGDAGQSLEGLVFPIPWHPAMRNIGNAEFVAVAEALWKGSVNWRTALSYDAMSAFFEAYRNGADTRDEIAKTMSASSFSVNGVTGSFELDESGDRVGSLLLLEIRNVPIENSRSGHPFDFVPIVSN